MPNPKRRHSKTRTRNRRSGQNKMFFRKNRALYEFLNRSNNKENGVDVIRSVFPHIAYKKDRDLYYRGKLFIKNFFNNEKKKCRQYF